MNVRENDRVQALRGLHDGKVGTVKTVYDIVDMAIVDFDDGTVGKVSLDRLVKIESQENHGAKSETPEIPEGAKYITKSEFVNAIVQVTKPDKLIEKFGDKDVTLVGLGAIMGGMKLVERLFKDTDIIQITEDQLRLEITKAVSDEEPKFMIIALMNSIILRDIVDILFSEPDND